MHVDTLEINEKIQRQYNLIDGAKREIAYQQSLMARAYAKIQRYEADKQAAFDARLAAFEADVAAKGVGV